MWDFFVEKRKTWAYLGFAFIAFFAWQMLLGELPDQIYIRSGEKLSVQCSLPMELRYKETDAANGAVQTISAAGEEPASQGRRAVCYLFGTFPVKEITVDTVEEKKIYASGRVIGIYEQTKGVLVLKTTEVTDVSGMSVAPAGNKVFSGDYILAVDEKEVSDKEELVHYISASGGKRMVLTIERGGRQIKVAVTPVKADVDTFLLGIWVKDDMAGIGTLTYYDKDGAFGALGHGIGDGETGELLSVQKGSIYTAALQGIARGKRGAPGELEGIVYYSTSAKLGSIASNSEMGIYGVLEPEDKARFAEQDRQYTVAYKQEIQTKDAVILSDISGETKAYRIKITDVDYRTSNSNKGLQFEVTDRELIALTGGIVQGMSGSPIIQNGKIIGAVTHVLVNDPTSGYGIFIEEMLSE